MTKRQVLSRLGLDDPWRQPLTGTAKPQEGWNNCQDTYDRIFGDRRPELMVEVGSWFGQSALHFQKYLTPDSCLICIDTWLGSLENWINPTQLELLGLKAGRPTIYQDFLATTQGMKQQLLPLPMPSVQGLKFLGHFGLRPDVIYIDGSHELGDVLQDMTEAWRILRPGGLLFGDDFGHPSVNADLKLFSSIAHVEPSIDGVKWFMTKPA